MANTLTALARNELGAVQAIRDQQKGLIAAVSTDYDATPIAVGESVQVQILSGATTADATPGPTSASGSDISVTTAEVTLTRQKKSSFHTAMLKRLQEEAGVTEDDLNRSCDQQSSCGKHAKPGPVELCQPGRNR